MRPRQPFPIVGVSLMLLAFGFPFAIMPDRVTPPTPAPPAAASWPRYHYRAALVRAVDGDTAVLRVRLGFDVAVEVSVRLLGIDTPELHGPERARALAARDALDRALRGRDLYVRTDRDKRTFTRYLADIFYETPDGTLRSVVDDLKDAGFGGPP